MHRKQLNAIMHSPTAYMRLQATGKLPRMVKPEGALIALLKQIEPRDRMRIIGLTINQNLGYTGSRVFNNAEVALRWCAPDDLMLENESWPAESWRLKRFKMQLPLSELLDNASSYPEDLLKKYSRLTVK